MISTNNEETAEAAPAEGEVKEAGAIGKAIYSTFYCLSYAVMFPTLYVAKAIPLDNAFGHGVCDGAKAASEASDRTHEKVAASTLSLKHKAGDAYATVAGRVQEKVESVQDKLAERRQRKSLSTT